MVPGSADIAIQCEPPFHRLVFIERNRRHVQALQRLAAAAPDRAISVLHQDANIALPDCLD